MNPWAWAKASDARAVLVGAILGPLLGIGVALATGPAGVGGSPAERHAVSSGRAEDIGQAPAELPTPGPPWGSSVDVEPRPRIAARVAHSPTPRPKVTPTPTPTPTATPSPTPAPPDGDDEQGDECANADDGTSEPQPAKLKGKPDKCKPAEDGPSAGPPDRPACDPPEVCEP